MTDADQFLSQFTPCDFPNLGFIRIPKVPVSDQELSALKLEKGASSDDLLYAIVKKGFNKKIKSGKIPKDKIKIYSERLREEYDTIKKLLFSDYILLINKIIQFCRDNGILNSPSRGSCGGSLLLYALDVIKIDPIKHNLLFERFVSAARTEIKEIDGELYLASANIADIDVDSDRVLKYKINEYIESIFPGKTAAILTFGTYQGKILLKEVLKAVEGANETEAKEAADMIEAHFGVVASLEETKESNPKFAAWVEKHKTVYEIANKLMELKRNKSVHASGVIICNDQLTDCMPTELTKEGGIVTSYDMTIAQLIGIKVDNLGLKNLQSIKMCLDMIGKTMDEIDVNDPSIYKFLETYPNCFYGIFQVEEGLGQRVIQKIKPKNNDDISVCISLGRPGTARFLDDFVKYRETGECRNIDPRVADILNPTGNIILFQENIMAIAGRMANFNPQERDGIRKAAGKKDVAKMKSYKDKFVENSLKNGYSQEFVDDMWRTFEESGNYLFCAAHGRGYSYLTCITAYLKANYTLQYFLCLLEMAKEGDTTDEISKIHKEMSQFGIKLLKPHILKSKLKFTIEGNDIRYGLLAIKGIQEKSMSKLMNFCKEYPSKFDMFSGAEEQNLNIGILCALIQAGAFEDSEDKNAPSRSKIVYEAQLWNILTDKEKKLISAVAAENNYDLVKIIKDLISRNDEKGKPLIKESRYATIKKHSEKYKAIYDANKNNEAFANWWYTKKLLGYSYGQTLKQIFSEKYPGLDDLSDVAKFNENQEVYFLASVNENSEKRTSKAGNPYLTFDVSDETGGINVKVFSRHLPKCLEMNNGATPKEDDIILVYGIKKDGGCIFAEEYSLLTSKIYTKLADLKKEQKEKEVANF